MESETILHIDKFSKAFDGKLALDNVSIEVKKSEILALVGETGAGKSVLIKLLAGVYKPDQGDLFLHGRKVKFSTTQDALNQGIAYVQQENGLFEHLSVKENIFIQKAVLKKHRICHVREKRASQVAAEILAIFDLYIDVERTVKTLSAAEKRLVSIARALAAKPSILLLDEPTDALTESESQKILAIMRDLSQKGTTIIFVTHRMNEAYAVSSRMAVLRDAKFIGYFRAPQTGISDLLDASFGLDYYERYPKLPVRKGSICLEVKDLAVDGVFRNIHLQLHQGEILGIAGLAGSGRSAIAKTIMGILRKTKGQILFQGLPTTILSPYQASKKGIGFLSEELAQNRFPNLDTLNNMMISRRGAFGSIHGTTKEKIRTRRHIQRLHIRPDSMKENILALSGGNQQKTIIARMMEQNCQVYILDEPTKSIDTVAKVEFYNIMNELTSKGAGIILISSDVHELMGMSDRIVVLCNGTISKELSRAEFDTEDIYRYASGIGGGL